jgi:hypothetical protein
MSKDFKISKAYGGHGQEIGRDTAGNVVTAVGTGPKGSIHITSQPGSHADGSNHTTLHSDGSSHHHGSHASNGEWSGKD